MQKRQDFWKLILVIKVYCSRSTRLDGAILLSAASKVMSMSCSKEMQYNHGILTTIVGTDYRLRAVETVGVIEALEGGMDLRRDIGICTVHQSIVKFQRSKILTLCPSRTK
jgi:hypothetical protein